ncbi:MAG TPA: hypothetical protein VJ754_03480, partial [Anaerolineae bacterium]|nr:hypothetical protein [Anaerolineae bacterium]
TKDIHVYVEHLEWTRAEVVKRVSGLTHAQLEAEPPKSRSIRAMLEHMLESEFFYVSSLVKVEGLP